MPDLDISILGSSSVTVAYKCVDGEWRCTALQFDLVGTGATREDAFAELRDIFAEYVTHAMKAKTKGKVAFYNPSDSEEWEIEDKQDFSVIVIGVRKKKKPSTGRMSFTDLRTSMQRVDKIDLLPVGCA